MAQATSPASAITAERSHVTVHNALETLRSISQDIERYKYIRSLKQGTPDVFYALLYHHVQEVLPYVYTPTVGEACQKYHKLGIQSWGLYISYEDRGNILMRMQQFTQQKIKVIVVTDGERILGLGDLGTGGMGISEGKIMLYTVAAGVDPYKCVPMCLDVGTNNQKLLDDPEYPGLRQKRVTGEDYDAFMKEFVAAVKEWQPHTVLQFEDFGNHNAFRLLNDFQGQTCCFNDDIQGTACVVLAGVLSAIRATGKSMKEQSFVFLGAGEAGIGIGELLAAEIARQGGNSIQEARKQCYFLDSKGLVCKSRWERLQHHKLDFAHDVPFVPNLLEAVRTFKPTALIGVSTIPSAFTREIVTAMAEINDRPMIFPLSNPTEKSECTFVEAMEWTSGRVLFASGSPFDPVERDGKTFSPAQANNAYVFPALGHAAVLAQAQSLPQEVFLMTAEALSQVSSVEQLQQGFLFPPFSEIIPTSRSIMLELCKYFEEQSIGTRPAGYTWEQVVDEQMWNPTTTTVMARM